MQAVIHATAQRQLNQKEVLTSLHPQASCQTGLLQPEQTVTNFPALRQPADTLQPFSVLSALQNLLSLTSVKALGADSLNAKCVKLCNTPS